MRVRKMRVRVSVSVGDIGINNLKCILGKFEKILIKLSI